MNHVIRTRDRPILVPIATLTAGLLAGAAFTSAANAQSGTWTLYPRQSTVYTTQVQQPINADGTSNFKYTGNAVIPVKFSLQTSPGPVVFQSILSDSAAGNDYSYLSFTPASSLTFSQITNLAAVYSFTEGNCHLGALRWSVAVGGGTVFIYYGDYPNYTNCTGTADQSGINMINQPDLRYDTTGVGGTFYDSYSHALALVGSSPVVGISLVLDGGSAGDQQATLGNVTVNSNTFVPASGSTRTCNLPPATIQISRISSLTTGSVNEPVSIQPHDDNLKFRVVDCKYMYNLATSSLPGTGKYKVEAVINGTPAGGAAVFDLR